MYIDLVLNPYKERNGKLLTWMDNCSSHCTNEVKRVFREDEIDVAPYPPNTTAMLQVMDLAVNGPIKNHTKQIRSKRIFDAFQGYLSDVDGKIALGENIIPRFTPPKAELPPAILDLLQLIETKFTTPEFKNGVKRTFYNSGMIPDENRNWNSCRQRFTRRFVGNHQDKTFFFNG